MNHSGSSFLTYTAASVGFIFFAKELDALARAGTPNSAFFVYDEDDGEDAFRKYDENVHWPAISMATIKPAGGQRVVVAIGHNGDFWELNPATTVETCGTISRDTVLRRLVAVGETIYACGMNRAVLERTGPGQWSPVGPPARDADATVVGFEGLAGFDAREMYAVGWHGELWWRDEGTWRRVESTTQANLTSVTCADDGFVYVVGHDGVLLKGRRDSWQPIETTLKEDLRDVAVFGGQLHVVSSSGVFALSGGGLVRAADVGSDLLRLSSTRDGLVLLGRKQLFVKRDQWQRLV